MQEGAPISFEFKKESDSGDVVQFSVDLSDERDIFI